MDVTTETGREVPQQVEQRTGLFAGRVGQKRREALLAYLLIIPAMFIIGLFALFPLVFAVYESTRSGINQVIGNPDGLGQYVRAIDSLAYVIAFWVALILVILGIQKIQTILETGRTKGESTLGWILPALLTGSGLSLLMPFVFIYLPNLLEVGEKMRQVEDAELRNEMFTTFIGESWQAENVSLTFWLAMAGIFGGLILFQVLNNQTEWETPRDYEYYSSWATAVFLFITAGLLAYVTYNQVTLALMEAIEDGEPLPLWSQIIMISAGFALLALSWILWRSAPKQDSMLRMGFRLFGAILLMVGGWILIQELPAVIAEGKDDWWRALRVTTWYVIGAMPIQLALGLLLATLMFQDIRGKGFFRMVYFLPYITPAVGAAAAFKIIFTGNPNGAMNLFLNSIGLEPLRWLAEPKGIFELIGTSWGFDMPSWFAGPSLALSVAILFGIWTYVGYNIVFFLAGLGNISKDLYEAASIDGASAAQKFRHITFPLLSPMTYFLVIFTTINIFKVFEGPFILRTGQALGTMDTASIIIFDAFNRDTRYGYASALGIILTILIIGVTTITNQLTQDKVFYE